MPDILDYLLFSALVGGIATGVMDLWAFARLRLLNSPSLDYGLVGRWLGYVFRGRFFHDPINASPPLPGERLIGWTAHYLIGIAFAAVLLAIWGTDWLGKPTLGPALMVGLGSVAAPFLVMQPGMGAGVAASRTPAPGVARLRSLVTHAVFGFGLYIGGWITHLLAL